MIDRQLGEGKNVWGNPWIKALVFLIAFLTLFWCAVPTPRFSDPYSTVLLDRDEQLLGATVATDEQWRFPESDSLPEAYVQALLLYEDRYFYVHPGINIISLIKSAYRDIRAGKIISGGSTITMQLARLAQKNPPRTFPEKCWEILMALKAEMVYSKKEILLAYAAHAPFGSNVVGLEAACWRFFGTPPDRLSWAQAATLAVLPNSPALIFPGRNQQLLKIKRNRLLDRLQKRGIIDSMTCELAQSEPVPGPPKDIVQLTPELATRLTGLGQYGKKIATSLDQQLQQQVGRVVDRYHDLYQGNQIYNEAALVVDVHTGKVVAYIGNAGDSLNRHGSQVDIIPAPRSYGSLLKPLLYLASLGDGQIAPESILPDYPANFGGFSPKNYALDFDGVVPADQALIRSLNIPSVFLLQRYGTPRFLQTLRRMGFTTFTQPATHYGLSLILGGAESSLWELTGAYASLAHRLNRPEDTLFRLSYLQEDTDYPASLTTAFSTAMFAPSSIWSTFNVLSELYRPGDDGRWQQFSSSEKIAWKTGTSFGNRDAWAIGVTSHYAVGVWVGNASGVGRPGLIGANSAAPILFDLFSLLPNAPWFSRPQTGWKKIILCRESGYRASPYCPDTLSQWLPAPCAQSPVCRFHQVIHLDPTGQYRVNSSCVNPADMQKRSWFVLSAVEELYYRQKHSNYRPLPPVMPGCQLSAGITSAMSLIYPSDGAKIYIPKEREGERGRAVFAVAHQDAGAVIYWHMDDHYLGSTEGEHKMAIEASFGEHRFTLVDDRGNTLSFTVHFLQRE
jgi:penicillin-binding protein 1C